MSGARLVFRPRLVPTLIAAPGILVLLALGTWQMERRAAKAELTATMQARLAEPPVRLLELLPFRPGLDYRPVVAVGRFRHDREMHLVARKHGERLGVEVVTPLILADGSAVLVNRGWVPEDRRAPATRPASLPEGEVEVRGILRWPAEPGPFTPANDPAKGQWYRVDPMAMAAAAGLTRIAPLVIEAAAGAPDSLPVGGRTRLDLPNNHLQYALTWYALAAALLATYILSQRRPAEPG